MYNERFYKNIFGNKIILSYIYYKYQINTFTIQIQMYFEKYYKKHGINML
jgi:hypothetical protein